MPRKIFITEEMADKIFASNDVCESLVQPLDNHRNIFRG